MGKLKTGKGRIGQITLLVIAAIVLLGVSGFAGWWMASQLGSKADKTPAPIAKAPTTEAPGDIRLIATGDMLAHDSVTDNAKLDNGDYDYTKYFEQVKTYTTNGDIRFCNQEGLSAGDAYGITGYPSFNAPKAFPRDLQKIGCNTINLANNHMADKGQGAIDETLSTWQALKPLAVAGANRTPAERDSIHYFTVKGVKIAFVAFNEVNNNTAASDFSVTLLEEPVVAKLMTEARANADFVMVSVHWGSNEGISAVSPIETQWVSRLVALGADTVIGTGPHVLQQATWTTGPDGRKVFVWYSLGNFLSTQLKLEERIGGIAMLKLEKTTDEKFPIKIVKAGFLPTYMHYDWPAADRAAEKLSTRTNLALYPLDKAAGPLSRSGFTTTIAEQRSRVYETLGPNVTLLTSETAKDF